MTQPQPPPLKGRSLLGAVAGLRWLLLAASLATATAQGGEAGAGGDAARIEERVVGTRDALLGFHAAYANNAVDADALQAENPMLDMRSRINRLPGARVTEGDAVGGNHWASRVYVRGMSVGVDTAQLGYMVDTMPNGDPVYGSGQQPGAFVDNENVTSVRVEHNTGDIASASNSALGGTIHYFTRDPSERHGLRLDYTGGEHGLRRLFARADSGELRPGLAGYVSVSDSALRSWIGAGSGRFERQHVDVKLVGDFAGDTRAELKAAWNHRNETDYNSITLADFHANPKSDHLLDDFDIDTAAYWRPGWGGTHWTKSAALTVRHRWTPKAAIVLTPYAHRQRGWGWWVPPYRVVTADGGVEGPRAAAEFYRGTFLRNAEGGLVPAPNTPVARHPCLAGRYPGNRVDYALAANFDCANAERLATRRRSGYWNRRTGATGEVEFTHGRHAFTAGFWLEAQRRDNNRQWFNLDPRDPGTLKPAAPALHWTHFDRRYDTTSQRFHIQDRMDFGRVELTAALVHHAVETDYASRLDAARRRQSRGAWLPKLGALYAWRQNIELFASYSRNVLMLADELLAAGTTAHLRPETSDNLDLGLRWNGERAGVAVQVFAQRHDDHLGAVNLAAAGGDHYLQGAIALLNVGGVDSNGLELAAAADLSETLSAYGAYSYLATRYTDTVPAEGIVAGNPLVNAPRHQWFGELVWRHAGWRLALNAQHVGERAADLAHSQDVPGYTLIGVIAKYDLPLGGVGRASVQLNASNLANERYLSAPDGDQGVTFFLGPARMVSLTLRSEFH